MICKKCFEDNWGIWTSSSTGKAHKYCRNCRRKRANVYSTRLEKSGGNHTKKQWIEKLKNYISCPICKRAWSNIPPRADKRYKFVWTKDHIIPLNKGGNNTIDNLQPLCYQCNFGKR